MYRLAPRITSLLLTLSQYSFHAPDDMLRHICILGGASQPQPRTLPPIVPLGPAPTGGDDDAHDYLPMIDDQTALPEVIRALQGYALGSVRVEMSRQSIGFLFFIPAMLPFISTA